MSPAFPHRPRSAGCAGRAPAGADSRACLPVRAPKPFVPLRVVFPLTASIHSHSISSTATRLSSLTTDQFSLAERRASSSFGKASSLPRPGASLRSRAGSARTTSRCTPETRVTEIHVRCGAKRSQQPLPLFRIDAAASAKLRKRFMRQRPPRRPSPDRFRCFHASKLHPDLHAPHRLEYERSDTEPTSESWRTAIAPLSASSRSWEPFLRRPRAPLKPSVRNLSNKNVRESRNSWRLTTRASRIRIAWGSGGERASRIAHRRDAHQRPKFAADVGFWF